MNTPTSETVHIEVEAFLQIFGELTRKADTSSYVYRGENAIFRKVSSSLYRRHERIDEEGSAIEAIQEEIIRQAKAHAPDIGDAEEHILAELRHNGGETNVIDFTNDFLIALFFACDGEPDEPGRVHLLPKIGSHYSIYEPLEPIHRVVAQKSVLVRPYRGFVHPEETITIDAINKPAILEYLRAHHGISSETVYNDLYGVIQHQATHRAAYNALYQGVALAAQGNYRLAIQHYSDCIRLNPQMVSAYNNRGDAYFELKDYNEAISDYQRALTFAARNDAVYHNLGVAYAAQGNYRLAIQHYDLALQLNHDDYTHYYRFEAWLFLKEWEAAKQAATSAEVSWADIVALFREYYEDVADFERRNDIQLPDNVRNHLED